MKFHLFLFCTLLSFVGQSQSYDWIQHLGSPGSDYSNNVKIDRDGNVYSTGFYRSGGFEIGGETLPYVDNMDSYLAKFNASGDLLWVVPFYGKGVFDRTEGLEIDEDGNVYLLSTIQEVQNIGDQKLLEIDSLNNIDILLLKFNPEGQLLWSKIYGGPSSDLAYQFLLRENDIVLAGHFNDTLNFDGIELVSHGGQDMFVASVDLEGTAQWARAYGGVLADRLYEVEEHVNGDLAVCGYAAGDWTFGSTTLDAREGRWSGFTGRLTADGEPKWARQITTEDNSSASAWSVAVDDQNNTYVTGTLTGLSKIDETVYDAKGTGQVFIVKYNSTGATDWVHVADVQNSMDYSWGGDLKYADGRIWFCGAVGRGMNFLGTEFNHIDTTNMYLAALDRSGNVIVDLLDGGPAYVLGVGIDIRGDIVLCSMWGTGQIEINGDQYMTRADDIMVAQIDFGEVISDIDQVVEDESVYLFPNPARELLNINVGMHSFEELSITDPMGRTVLRSQMKSQIDVSQLSPGSYFVRLHAEDYIVSRTVVIVR